MVYCSSSLQCVVPIPIVFIVSFNSRRIFQFLPNFFVRIRSVRKHPLVLRQNLFWVDCIRCLSRSVIVHFPLPYVKIGVATSLCNFTLVLVLGVPCIVRHNIWNFITDIANIAYQKTEMSHLFTSYPYTFNGQKRPIYTFNVNTTITELSWMLAAFVLNSFGESGFWIQ